MKLKYLFVENYIFKNINIILLMRDINNDLFQYINMEFYSCKKLQREYYRYWY